MNELVAYAQSIMSFLEKNGFMLNIVSQQALGELLLNILQLIETQEVPTEPQAPPTLTNQPEIAEAMPSSNIAAFGYDDKQGRLLVRFLGKYPNKNGPVYEYSGVPIEIFDLFRKGAVPARTDGQNKWGKWWRGKVPSIGASLYTLLKTQNYPYQRVS